MRTTSEDFLARTCAGAATDFAERLAALHLDDWLAVATASECDAPARSTARAVLDALIANSGLGMQAWSVLDDIETIAHCAFGQSWGGALSRRVAERLRVARSAAAAAALAILARPLLCRDDFELLYQPFASLIPP